MSPKLYLLPVLLCLTSCATIFNSKEYQLKIYSNNTKAQAKVYDSVYKLPADVAVKRSKDDLKVTLITDSLNKEFTVKSRLSPEFRWGNIAFVPVMPIGYITDLTNPKRFYYGKEIMLNDNDTVNIINEDLKKRYTTEKGQFNLLISMPYGNLFYMQPQNESSKTQAGFFGISIGAEYYYKDVKYIKFTAGSSIDFLAPVPAPVTYDGAAEFITVYNFALTDNYKLGRFTLGYGLNYGIYKWRLNNNEYIFPSTVNEPRTSINHGLGIATNVYYQFSKAFFLGVVYNPTFITTYPKTEFNYQHVISLDLQWKIKL
ncbi:hypothetical protein D3C87_243570 [compost metagenome]